MAAAAGILAPGGSALVSFPRRRLPELLAAIAAAGLSPDILSLPATPGLPVILAGAAKALTP
jgi:hypothetical protein